MPPPFCFFPKATVCMLRIYCSRISCFFSFLFTAGCWLFHYYYFLVPGIPVLVIDTTSLAGLLVTVTWLKATIFLRLVQGYCLHASSYCIYFLQQDLLFFFSFFLTDCWLFHMLQACIYLLQQDLLFYFSFIFTGCWLFLPFSNNYSLFIVIVTSFECWIIIFHNHITNMYSFRTPYLTS